MQTILIVTELNFDALTTREWLALSERCEKLRRRLPVPEHQLINNLARQATDEELPRIGMTTATTA